jgi:hypothetical protein
VASYNTLLHIFERIHFFLQRLKCYTGIPLSNDFTELLGKIMAQILSILALSTKEMTERWTNALTDAVCSFLAGYFSEKFLKWLMGKTNVEDALLRLDSLMKEENLRVAAENLEVAYRVDGNVETMARNQLREKLRSWLSPPNPSKNHNETSKMQHAGTSSWFIQGDTFRDWKNNGSLLWIRGNRTLVLPVLPYAY